MIDIALIKVKAGDGGNGSAHFRREKYVPKGGPDGGDGGDGGSVYLHVNPNLRTLDYFASHQKFHAEAGVNGTKRNRAGAKGDDKVIEVPEGTLIWEFEVEEKMTRDELYELLREIRKADNGQQTEEAPLSLLGEALGTQEQILVAQGGRGGLGNWHFKSSINTTPMFAQPGTPGVNRWLLLELKILADIGLIGLPNAGKSTLLSVLTAARPKIADYPFTTLEPNLGVMKVGGFTESQFNSVTDRPKELVLADIPGLIEGASAGKGLGDEFLRHIERCKMLIHVLGINPNFEALNREQYPNSKIQIANQLFNEYQTIRKELTEYGGGLAEKPEIVVVNKTDLVGEQDKENLISDIEKFFAKKGINKIIFTSAATNQGIEELRKAITSA